MHKKGVITPVLKNIIHSENSESVPVDLGSPGVRGRILLYVFLHKTLNLGLIEQDPPTQLLGRLAIADGPKVKNLGEIKG